MCELIFEEKNGALNCIDEDFFNEYEIQKIGFKNPYALRINGEVIDFFSKQSEAINRAKKIHQSNYSD